MSDSEFAGEAQSLDSISESLIRVSVALATREEVRVREALGGAAVRADAEMVEEVLLQSHLFLGYPAALQAFAVWRDLTDREVTTDSREDRQSWSDRGAHVCRLVYGARYQALRRNIATLHPELDRWMIEDGYGKVLGRPGLALKTRELCIVGILAVLGNEVPLYSHLRGALATGATRRQVEAALEIAWEVTTPSAREAAQSCWDRLLERR